MSTTEPATGLTPAEMAGRTGVSIDTLRYYEREGLLAGVSRASSGHRRYREDDVLWVEVLRCLRATGMSMQQLRNYCDLGQHGDHTRPDRRRLLIEHRAEIEAQIAERHEALRLIDRKLAHDATDVPGEPTGTTTHPRHAPPRHDPGPDEETR